ncbi:MAG TPA: nucleotide exchange factor GrpE [Terriglobia bacterium]|nr:nucleotide exchange factor GrpE [Terriglobia bacterium]
MIEEKEKEVDLEDSQKGRPIPVRINTPVSDEPVRVTDRRFWVNPPQDMTQDGPPVSLKPTYVEEMEKLLADSERKQQELLAAHREFKANMAQETRLARERIQSEYNKRLIQAKGEVAVKFIQVLENLDRALAAADGAADFRTLLEGVQLIRNQLRNALSELGLDEVSPLGEPFNPELAEAVQVIEVESEADDNVVMDVVARGYSMNGHLVRPARVVVGRCQTSQTPSPVQEPIN